MTQSTDFGTSPPQLFQSLSVPCTCEGLPEPDCPCAAAGGAEKVLRFVVAMDGRLSPAQREWCLRQIDQVEGYRADDYVAGTDADVARGVLSAWTDYCRDIGSP